MKSCYKTEKMLLTSAVMQIITVLCTLSSKGKGGMVSFIIIIIYYSFILFSMMSGVRVLDFDTSD